VNHLAPWLLFGAAFMAAPLAHAQKLSDIECFKSPTCRAEKEAVAQAQAEARERDHKAALARQAQQEADEERAEAALKKACGKDYMAPRIGMPIKRALQCLGGFALVRQVNRKDGVLSTYESNDGEAWLHELGGRVVAWGQN